MNKLFILLILSLALSSVYCLHRNQFLKKSHSLSCINIELKSLQFNNVYIRGDGNSNTVNLQYGSFAWEKWIARQEQGGYYCFENNYFRGKFLSLDTSGCTKWQGPGCGKTSLVTSCNANAKFLVVNNNGVNVGLMSHAAYTNNNVRIFLRLDGTGTKDFNGSGSGTVNAQYYGVNGGDPKDWERVQFVIKSYC